MGNKTAVEIKMATDLMMGSAAVSPIPTPQISTLAAPGKPKGLTGMAPRVSNSRVNTGVAPAMDAGTSEQKSVAPAGASMLKSAQLNEDRMATMMGRPSVQEMITAAIAGTAERLSVTDEALHQMKLASEGCSKCGKSPCECKGDEKKSKPVEDEKTASAQIERLASALDYAALLVKEGSVQIDAGSSSGTGPGEGPNALTVMESPGGPAISTNSGQAISKDIPPKNPPMQKGLTGPVGGGASLMKNDLDRAPGGSGNQQTALPGGPALKTAGAPIDLILKLAKEKKAEDALNPAHISAGRTTPPDTRESGQAGPASPHGSSMVGSSQSVTNLTRREAKAGPKADMRAYVDQPALSAAHDHVLQNAFAHTGQAGAKIAGADSAQAAVKTAAARAYLEQLVDDVKTAIPGGK